MILMTPINFMAVEYHIFSTPSILTGSSTGLFHTFSGSHEQTHMTGHSGNPRPIEEREHEPVEDGQGSGDLALHTRTGHPPTG